MLHVRLAPDANSAERGKAAYELARVQREQEQSTAATGGSLAAPTPVKSFDFSPGALGRAS